MFFVYSVYCTDRERKSLSSVTSFEVVALYGEDV